MEPTDQTMQQQPDIAAQPVITPNIAPMASSASVTAEIVAPAAVSEPASTPISASPSVSASTSESMPWKPQLKVTYAFAITLAVLGIAIGAVGMYYYDLQQQTAASQAQMVVASVAPAPSVPLSPHITFPTGADTITKGAMTPLRWTPVRLQNGDLTELWIGRPGAMAQVGHDGDIQAESGMYTFAIDDQLWRALKLSTNQKLNAEIRIGYNQMVGSSTQFVTESVLATSFAVADSTSTATSTK